MPADRFAGSPRASGRAARRAARWCRPGPVGPGAVGTGATGRLARSTSGWRAGDVSAVSGGSRQQRRARCRRVWRGARPGVARRREGDVSTARGGPRRRRDRRHRSQRRWPARSGRHRGWKSGQADFEKRRRLSLARGPAARAADGGRSAHQLVRHRRRHRDPIRAADAEAGDRRIPRAFRAGDPHRRRRHADRLAERRHAGRLRSPRGRDRSSPSSG